MEWRPGESIVVPVILAVLIFTPVILPIVSAVSLWVIDKFRDDVAVETELRPPSGFRAALMEVGHNYAKAASERVQQKRLRSWSKPFSETTYRKEKARAYIEAYEDFTSRHPDLMG